MAAPTVATEVKPLTDEEKGVLGQLLARSLATGGGVQGQGSATERTGDLYEALTNLSVPRRNDPEHRTDLVLTGNTIRLSEAEAALYLPPNKPVACIRKVKRGQATAPRIPARALSGRLMAPPQKPPEGYTGPRADPPGSSQAIIIQPESNEPHPGDENLPPVPHAGQDAVDLAPGGGHAERARAAAKGG